MQDTLLVIGDSPFLKEVNDKIFYAIDRYNSIGINRTILKYPVKNHILTDLPMVKIANQHSSTNTISISLYGDLIKEPKELFSTFSFDIENNTADDIVQGRRLAWCGFTHDFALSYAIYKGYKRVFLIGAADFIDGGHAIENIPFEYSESLREASIKFIEEFCTQKLQVYTCNKKSCLCVPYKPLDELLT